jgi:hypothetical protein
MFDPDQYSDKRMEKWSKVKEAKHKQQDQKGRASLSPVKHKVDVAGQESYKEEDK